MPHQIPEVRQSGEQCSVSDVDEKLSAIGNPTQNSVSNKGEEGYSIRRGTVQVPRFVEYHPSGIGYGSQHTIGTGELLMPKATRNN